VTATPTAGIAAAFAAELKQEAATTRRVLERVPQDKFSWKPHPKSMSLGQLALHVAAMPGGVAQLISTTRAEVPRVPLPEAKSREELLTALEASVVTVTTQLATLGDNGLRDEWKLVNGGHTILALPRSEVVRSVILNHWYHHRGQLTVYLRMLDVPLPVIYGPTADENPFA
jgi:uncharacterized damage-inducible protein DinB